MSGYVDWIAAVADDVPCPKPIEPGGDKQFLSKAADAATEWQGLPAHNFPTHPAAPNEAQMQNDPLDRNPDLWMYRKRTVSLLHRYWRFSLETGRLPSFVGRECFRAKISFYTSATFEDRVIFVRDVEKSLERLEYWDQQLIARIIFQEYSHEKAAHILHCSRSTVERRFPFVLDLISEDFLRVGLLAEAPTKGRAAR